MGAFRSVGLQRWSGRGVLRGASLCSAVWLLRDPPGYIEGSIRRADKAVLGEQVQQKGKEHPMREKASRWVYVEGIHQRICGGFGSQRRVMKPLGVGTRLELWNNCNSNSIASHPCLSKPQ